MRIKTGSEYIKDTSQGCYEDYKVMVICKDCHYKADDSTLTGTTSSGACKGCGGSNLVWGGARTNKDKLGNIIKYRKPV